jgi:hypothetical protein
LVGREVTTLVIYTHTYTIHNTHTHTHIHTHTYTHTHAHTHIHAHTHARARTRNTQLSSRRIAYLDTQHTNTWKARGKLIGHRVSTQHLSYILTHTQYTCDTPLSLGRVGYFEHTLESRREPLLQDTQYTNSYKVILS